MANKVSDFFENTTKVFSGVIKHNGSNPDTSSDVITFMMKISKNLKDADAIIKVNATGLGVGGIWTITLTAAITKITPRSYHYELVWYLAGGAGIYVLDQSDDNIRVKEKYQDNV